MGDNRNPIEPCGVCMEMLLKIQAESPDFKIVSYSDIDFDDSTKMQILYPHNQIEEMGNEVPKELLKQWDCQHCHQTNGSLQSRCKNCGIKRLKKKWISKLCRMLLQLTAKSPTKKQLYSQAIGKGLLYGNIEKTTAVETISHQLGYMKAYGFIKHEDENVVIDDNSSEKKCKRTSNLS